LLNIRGGEVVGWVADIEIRKEADKAEYLPIIRGGEFVGWAEHTANIRIMKGSDRLSIEVNDSSDRWSTF
jgi:hypothetical protein